MAVVLAVDDDATALEIRKLILERHGHTAIVAADAGAARRAFANLAIDVVVTDLRLPELADGLALIRDFRAAHAELRIVVLCGNSADIEGREEASLVNAILTKPVRSEVLLQALG